MRSWNVWLQSLGLRTAREADVAGAANRDVSDGPGTGSARARNPARSRKRAQARGGARYSFKHRALTLAALLTAATPVAAAAQMLANYDYENLSFRGIGVDWGRIWPNKVDDATVWTMKVDLGFLGPAVRLVPSVSYWKSNLKASELDRLAASLSALPALQQQGITLTADDLGDVEWSALSLAMDAHLVWTAPLRLFTYIGTGLGLHAMNGSGSTIGDTFVEDLLDTMTPGVAFMAGLEFQATRVLRAYAEGRYTLQSEVRYPGLRLGLALMVPQGSAGTQ